KDVMAFLRLLIDPDDDLAVSRIANVSPRGLSAHAIEQCRTAASLSGRSLWQELRAARDAGRISNAAGGGVGALERLVSLRASGPQAGAAETLRSLLDQAGYRRHLDKEYDDDPSEAEARWQCVEEVANALAHHEKTNGSGPGGGEEAFARMIRRFLDDLILDVTEAERFESDKDKDKGRGNKLRLMTLHAAKGLEFDCVWMVGMEEGLLPHIRSINDGLQAIDEERRLCYVGVTRARKRLSLSLCLTRMKWGKTKPCRPSRFLYELTGQADKFREQPTEPAAAPAPVKGGRHSKRVAKRR
ncbi:MAG: 3'-5' exonuclease, partial [Planctomycetia bacterium]